MPRAGLAEPARQVLRTALSDAAVLARFRAKIVTVPGSDCQLWASAISGRGHGRFWVGTAGGRGVVVAHRFAWAVQHGADALEEIPVLGHRCDNPLCQRIGDGHVMVSDPWRNRREWVLRRRTIGGPLRDIRGAAGRARALREAVRRDPTLASLTSAIAQGLGADVGQLPLWDEPTRHAGR